MQTNLKTLYDVLQLLKKYGFIIYFDKEEDRLVMIENEIENLYHHQLINRDDYIQSKRLINQRRMELT
ncbi:YqgQ family protein [Staphylococcus canis]|uniref:YqgQ family protein n=1 Tax=Staphylococcus canis TaxID=2724942 RepID=A0ABS0TCF8_9STAP|nr:YqgQ family protein [Staphylococcus canis]MBI5975651.1 YqgQ family protein [Staphylococcus canis]